MTGNAWPRSEVIYGRFFRSSSHSPNRENHSRYVQMQERPSDGDQKLLALSGRFKRTRESVSHTCIGQVGDCWSRCPPQLVRIHIINLIKNTGD